MVTVLHEFSSCCNLVFFGGGERVEEWLLFVCSMMIDVEESLIEIQGSVNL